MFRIFFIGPFFYFQFVKILNIMWVIEIFNIAESIKFLKLKIRIIRSFSLMFLIEGCGNFFNRSTTYHRKTMLEISLNKPTKIYSQKLITHSRLGRYITVIF